MPKPRTQAMPGIVLHRAHLGRGPKRAGYPLGRALVVRRERDADVAVVEDRVVWPVGAFKLVEALSNQEAADAIACHEGKLAFKEVEPSESSELIEHQEQLLSLSVDVQALGQSPPYLVQNKSQEGLRAGNVGWRYHQVERDGTGPVDEIADAPVAPSRDLGDNGIAI